ncbi:hypothetical protein R1479_01495 [Ralstonia mannitolilytica]|uniref:PglL family O-oligosaccharyltransferase n=1 Tax=Ralstonia mannitolilytica TaxID=105219 RepID=UPI0028F5DB80|nr:Wzy polymerase domain-containing protein [Ralstonia mannitolilytica]CAJ0868226.1 hypothetical protein R1479_01495 [Ralstonia mannitolilytica]
MRRLPLAQSFLYLAIGLGWSLPFLIAPHTYPVPTFYSETAAAIVWSLAALVILGTTWRSSSSLPVAALAPAGLALVLLLQLVIAPPLNPILSFAAIIALLAACGIAGLAARCGDMPGFVKAIAIGAIIGGLLTVAIELLQLFKVQLPMLTQWMSFAPEGPGRRMWGNLNQPNHVASYLAMGLAACMFLLYRLERWRWVPAVIALPFLVGMALTFSRTAWIHIAVVGVLASLLQKSDRGGPRGWAAAVIPLVALMICYQLCNTLIAYANEMLYLGLPTSLGERMEHGVSDRTPLWKHAWHIFLAHPLVGGGWGDYAYNQYVQTDVLGDVVMSMNAHNIVLDLLAKVGVVGFLAVVLPCLGLPVAAWRRKLTPEYAFFYAVILILGAHSMLEYPLHYLYFLFPCAFAAGWIDDRVLPKPSPKMAWTLTTTFTVVGVALLVKLWPDYKIVERLYYSQGDYRVTLQTYERNPVTLLSPYATLAIAMNMAVSQDMAPIVAGVERQAVQLYPGPGTVQRYAVALAFQGKIADAVTQMRRLRHQYWTDYAAQTGFVQSACSGKLDGLEPFCSRLKSEGLLLGGK